MKEKISFKQLSTPLKVAVITAWVVLALYVIAFGIGFVQGFIYG